MGKRTLHRGEKITPPEIYILILLNFSLNINPCTNRVKLCEARQRKKRRIREAVSQTIPKPYREPRIS